MSFCLSQCTAVINCTIGTGNKERLLYSDNSYGRITDGITASERQYLVQLLSDGCLQYAVTDAVDEANPFAFMRKILTDDSFESIHLELKLLSLRYAGASRNGLDVQVD